MKKLGTFKLELKSKEATHNIGKINDISYPIDKATMKKESKLSYKLIPRKSSESSEFTGSKMSDQTARYLLMTFVAGRSVVEVIPVNNWYYFKKDIKYKTKTTEEAEEELKKKSVNKLTKKAIKHPKEKESKNTNSNKAFEEDLQNEEQKNDASDDDRQFFNTFSSFKTKKVRIAGNNEEDENDDHDLEGLPSDLEEFIKEEDKTNKSTKEIIKKGIDSDEESSKSENQIESEVDENSSDEMEKDEIEDMKRLSALNNLEGPTSFLNHKRLGENINIEFEKKIKEDNKPPLEDVVKRIFQKNVQIKYEELSKELRSQGYTLDLQQNREKLNRFLSSNCKKFVNKNNEEIIFLNSK